MSLKTKMFFKVFWALFSIFSVFGAIFLTVQGFRGVLPAYSAGFGWACASICFLGSMFGDVAEALESTVEYLDDKKF